MQKPEDFAKLAQEAEQCAAAASHPLVRMTFEILAKEYRLQAEQSADPFLADRQPPAEAKL